MDLSRLKRASEYEIEQWLKDELSLTPYQKEVLRDRELVRLSGFYFFKRRQVEKSSLWWRLTIFALLIYIPALYIFMPIKFVVTGEFGYGEKFLESFHNPWMRKLKLN